MFDRSLPLLPRRPLSAVLLMAAAVGVAGVLALWWRQTPADRLQSLPDYLVMMAQITGLVGAYLLLVEIALMARFQWLERRIGSWLASAHRNLGGYLVLLLLAHFALVIAAYSVSLHDAPPAVLVSVLRTYPGVLAATIGLLVMLLAGLTSARSIRRRLGYEGWHGIHLLLYPAAAAAFWHQLTLGAQFSRNRWAAGAWAGLHTIVAVAVISNRIVLPFLNNRRHRFRVSRVEEVGTDVVSVYISGRHVAELGAEAGQYFRWRFMGRGLWYQAHPFSLSAAPSADTLRLTFKCVGGYTKRLRRRLRPGARVLVDGPYGAFTGVLRRQRGVVMIGGGIGVTPLRAIAETMPGYRRDIVFIQRASKVAELILTRELEALDQAGRLIYIPAVGSRKNDPLSADRLLDLVPDIEDREVFICGSPGLASAVIRNLRRAKVRRGRIHTEIFDF
ncbi:ferredoxin reductase family protein [Catenulispora subtropica]|uniref:Ferredoxin reductase family protein n=1 Tax=Catenulispora subtropica TaxID=450798 RepID=A0ABP5EVB6_9ACTN